MESKKEIPNSLRTLAAESYSQGLEEYKKGYLNAAFTHFSTAIDINPNLADALYYIGLIYTEMDDLGLAERYYNMALGADPNHIRVKRKLGLEKDLETSAKVKITDTDFFYRLQQEGTPEAAKILESLEKMDFALDLKPRSHTVEHVLRFIAGALKLLVPAVFAGLLVGMGLSGMGYGSFSMMALLSGGIIFLVQIIEKFR